ncbi:MAG: porin family protein [Bacteroidaceae bacterium]|nr:porin family protein [Bacteroidaceae bacterium]
MKRLLIFLTSVFALTATVSAQTQFGVEAGAIINKMSFSKDVFKSDNCSGFFIGPKLKTTIPILGLGADAALLYAHRTAEINDAEHKHMSYARVPVNVRWEIGPRQFGAYVSTGPQWDWLIGNSNLSTREGLRATFNHSVFSWNVGFGLMLFSHLQVGASYCIPLSKAGSVKDVYEEVTDNISMKNKEWQVRLNYFF